MEKTLDRLIFALDAKGFQKHGRATKIAKSTGYSVSMVSDILRGKADLSDRFLKTLCRELGLSEVWVKTGEGEMAPEKSGSPMAAERETEYATLAKVRELLPPEKRILFDEIIKMSNEEAEVMLRDHIARLRDRLERER